MPRSLEGKLRSQNEKKGSEIWNLINANRDIIREHNFREVRGGDKATFWEEAWQYRGKINNQPQLKEVHQFTNLHEGNIVLNYWCLEPEGYWRNWKQ